MEKRKAIVVCGVVGLVGLLSVATGLAAEFKGRKYNQITVSSPSECIHSHGHKHILDLAFTASVSLVMAQVIISVATVCIFCRKVTHRSQSEWFLAIIYIAGSWFACLEVLVLFLTSSFHSDENESSMNSNSNCFVTNPGAFAGGSIISGFILILGIVFYLILMSSENKSHTSGAPVVPPNQDGIAMVPPQFPPEDAVFVHEDTYMRRQFT